MPIHLGRDVLGSYYRYGKQKKYYFIPDNERSKENAYIKCVKQARAIYARWGKSG